MKNSMVRGLITDAVHVRLGVPYGLGLSRLKWKAFLQSKILLGLIRSWVW